MNNKWLDSAIRLDLGITMYEEYATSIANLIFGEIKIKGGLYQQKYKEVFIKIIANLRVSYELMRPLHYSRNKTYYPQDGVGYTTLFKLIDTMVDMKFIEHVKGQQNFDDGKESRMWIERRINTLFDLFIDIHPSDVVKEPPTPIVRLKTRKEIVNNKTIPAIEIPYRMTEKTYKMEEQLYQYNDLLKNIKIELHIDWNRMTEDDKEKLVKQVAEKRYSKLDVIYPAVMNRITPDTNINTIVIPDILNKVQVVSQTNGVPVTTNTITKSFFCNQLLYYDIDQIDLPPHLSQDPVLGIGISLKYKCLHRSFTENFNQGGRFYGASWIDISRHIRPYLFIEGEKVCEPDFSCLHPRMLYNKIGIDYKDDIYSFVKKEDERGLAKMVAMIVINCKNKKDSTAAIKKAFGWKWCKTKGGSIDYKNKHIKKHGTRILNKEVIKKLVNDFVSAHSRISEYFFNDVGLKLQNTDSNITYNILNYFIAQGIPILCVHDSFIAQQRYREELVEIMKEKYRDEIGYDPIVH